MTSNKSTSRRLLAMVGVLATLSLAAISPPSALADQTQFSIFQDDKRLVYSPTGTVKRTLAELKSLGVNTIRVTLKWSDVVPGATSRKMPKGFIPTNPSTYSNAQFAPYDRIVLLAAKYGINVQFNLTAPGPLWAMGPKPVSTVAANHWYPNATQFGQFVYAVGLRYSGKYYYLPKVSDWSVWNEPDQPGWLAPQSAKINGKWVAEAPQMDRKLIDAAYTSLFFTGHGSDTILIGELAPEGDETPGGYTSMTPMPFLRDLYCVNGSYRPLTGTAASPLGCPSDGSTASFVKQNPALFKATGFSHHPYYFSKAPNVTTPDVNWVPLSNLGRLETGLNRVMSAYSVHRQIPIYLTEYGYQTNPPDPYQVVTPAEQAVYLNQADYLAWRNPRVKSVAQFLLYDSAPNPAYKPSDFDYWDTFQTGLAFINGTAKPALAAYKQPLFIPSSSFNPGAQVSVWGQLRSAPRNTTQHAEIQWQPSGGAFKTLATVTVSNPQGYFTAQVKPPGTGFIRIAYTPSSGTTVYSRSAPVTAR